MTRRSTTYMAPEVTNESGHHKPVDVYAAGVIMYIMLCGYPPFEPENGIVELEFPEREWEDISDAAKELITRLLDEDPMRRPTPEEVLRHRWFLDVETIRNPKNLANAVNTIKKFTELGPNGTMKEYRGDGKANRGSIINFFENDGTASPPPPVTANTTVTTAPISQIQKIEDPNVVKNDIKKKRKKTSRNCRQKINTERTSITKPQSSYTVFSIFSEKKVWSTHGQGQEINRIDSVSERN